MYLPSKLNIIQEGEFNRASYDAQNMNDVANYHQENSGISPQRPYEQQNTNGNVSHHFATIGKDKFLEDIIVL